MEDRTLDGLTFVSEKEVKCSSVEEALDNLPPFLSIRTIVDPANVKFDFNGNAQFTIDGQPYNTTRYAVKSLCKLAKVPDPFAKMIPLDLLKTNFDRLVPTIDKVIEVVKDPNGDIIAFVPKSYRPIRTIDLLTNLQNTFKTKPVDNLVITLNTRNMLMSYTSPTLPKLEPREGDFISIGVETTNSELHDLDAQANLSLLRLVCTNGMTMPTEWGKITRNLNTQLSYEAMLASFTKKLNEFKSNFEGLKIFFNVLPDLSLCSDDVVTTYKMVKQVFDGGTAADMLAMEEKDIKELVTFEKERTDWRVINTTDSKYGVSPQQTDVNAYDTYNRITEFGRDFHSFDGSRKARMIAGVFITKLYRGLNGTSSIAESN